MDFLNVKAITIPEGNVKQITDSDNNILWKVNGSILPDGYTQLEYLHSDRTNYIMTDWNPGGNGKKFRHEATMSDYVPHISGNGETLFGNWQSGSRIGGFWRAAAYNGNIVVSVGGGEYLTDVASGLTDKETWKLEIDDANKTVVWDKNGTIYTTNYLGNVYRSGNYLYIFAGMSGGEKSSYKLYDFKTYEFIDGVETLTRHYIPAQRNSDNAKGLYDIVNDNFFFMY